LADQTDIRLSPSARLRALLRHVLAQAGSRLQLAINAYIFGLLSEI
jgi:hypothetical protein